MHDDFPTLLAPAPVADALIGYARVSTRDQRLDHQVDALNSINCVRVFSERVSGRNAARPELAACLDYLRPGDILVATRLDRLGRSLADLIEIVGGLGKRGIGFRSLHEALDTSTPGGRLIFHVFAALAEFIRELIVEGTRDGLAAARARGQRLGRPPALTSEQVFQARQLLTNPENTIASIARLLGVSRSTLYSHVPELQQGQRPVLGSAAAPAAVGVGTGERPSLPVAVSLLREIKSAKDDLDQQIY
jgi:DNA invertase Pin-like site-specific DNA recombinase